jgi:hypothetical protein
VAQQMPRAQSLGFTPHSRRVSAAYVDRVTLPAIVSFHSRYISFVSRHISFHYRYFLFVRAIISFRLASCATCVQVHRTHVFSCVFMCFHAFLGVFTCFYVFSCVFMRF